jgi:lipid A 3-O-deacylase
MDNMRRQHPSDRHSLLEPGLAGSRFTRGFGAVAAACLLVTLSAACHAAPAAEATSLPRPSSVFVQFGDSSDAHTLVAGAIYDTGWNPTFSWGHATSYVELSFGRWVSDRDPAVVSSAWTTQIGFTPVLRFQPTAWHGWYAEAGIGANVLLPVFRSRDKRFSTVFNFGDHVAIGHRFGETGQNEIALRVQHFSNAGIKHPNPGENFLQLRFSHRF